MMNQKNFTPFLIILSAFGCASPKTKVVDNNEFKIKIMDTLRSPGVRVEPDFKWTKSKYADLNSDQRVNVLIPIAKEAALHYCKSKDAKTVAVFEETASVLGSKPGLLSTNTPPLGIEVNFKCK